MSQIFEDYSNLSSARQKRNYLLKKKIKQQNKPKKIEIQPTHDNGGQSKAIKMGSIATVIMAKNKLDSSRYYSNSQKSIQSSKQESMNESQLVIKDENQENDQIEYEFHGPQLKFNKVYLSFIVQTGIVDSKFIQVTNNGSTAIYFEWQRIENKINFKHSISDSQQRFFCHHKKNVIKPGQAINFQFSFRSTITGIFYEDWILKCEPPLIDPLPKIKFTGHACEQDDSISWRKNMLKDMEEQYIHKNMLEIVDDILFQVKTPTPPLPDLANPKICKQQFELKNKERRLYYTSFVLGWFRQLIKVFYKCIIFPQEIIQELYNEIGLNAEEQYWDLSITYIEDLLEKVNDIEKAESFKRRYETYYNYASIKPYAYSDIYPYFRQLIENFAKKIPTISNQIREELNMWEYSFQAPQEQDLSALEIQQKKQQEDNIKQEWLKKSKRKKWNEEEEKQKLQENAFQQLALQINNFDNENEYIISNQIISKRERLSIEYFEQLQRKKSLLDLNVEGNRVFLRVHLKLISCPNVDSLKKKHEDDIIQCAIEEKQEQEIHEEQLKLEQQKKGRKQQKDKKAQQQQQELQQSIIQERKNRLLDLSFLDQQNVKDIVETVKYCSEHLAKLVILQISYDKPIGFRKELSSVKFFAEYLKTVIDQQVLFYDQCLIEEFNDAMENDIFPDNSVLVLENCFFLKEEIGFQIQSDEPFNMTKLDFDDRKSLINEIEQYANPFYIIENKSQIFSNQFTSISYVRPDTSALGISSSKNIKVLTYYIQLQKSPSIMVMGGPINASKLQAIDTMLNFFDTIMLLGEIGVYFIMDKRGLQELMGYILNQAQRQMIQQIYKNLQQINDQIQAYNDLQKILHGNENQFKIKKSLIIPNDLSICPIPQFENDVQFSIDNIDHQQIMLSTQFNIDMFPELKQEGGEIAKSNENQTQQEPIEQYKMQLKIDSKSPKTGIIPKDTGKTPQQKKQTPTSTTSKQKQTPKTGVIEQNIKELEEKNPFEFYKPENHLILDYGTETLANVQNILNSALKIVWVGISSVQNNHLFNATNKLIAKTLFIMQEKKRKIIQDDLIENSQHDYSNDLAICLIGNSLANSINNFDLVLPFANEQVGIAEVNASITDSQMNLTKDHEQQSELITQDDKGSQGTQTNVVTQKANNVALVADNQEMFADDEEFCFKIMAGNLIYGFQY